MYDEDATRITTTGPQTYPRLILKKSPTENEEYTLDKELFWIGRTNDCDIVLKEKSISRRHAAIRNVSSSYILEDHSVNGTLVNGLKIKEKALENGDLIEIGNSSVVYVFPQKESSLVDDEQTVVLDPDKTVAISSDKQVAQFDFSPKSTYTQKPAPPKPTPQKPSASKVQKPSFGEGFKEEIKRQFVNVQAGLQPYIWGAVLLALLLSLGIYLWKLIPSEEKELYQTAIILYENKSYEKAIDEFTNFIEKYPLSKYTNSAKKFLGLSYISKSRIKAQAGNYGTAKEILKEFISAFPYNPEISDAREKINFYRLKCGLQLENEGRYEQALAEYLAIPEDSKHFREAKRRASELSQSQKKEDDIIEGLIQEGDRYFAEQHYLIPPDNNAYAVFKKVLLLSPANEIALKRIQQMKEYYLQESQENIIKGDYGEALISLDKCYTIDPQDEAVKNRIERLKELHP